jgi:NADH-quinone oxidoreductase subunit G
VRIGLIGEAVDLTYPVEYLGAGPESLAALADGKGDFAKTLAEAKRPIVLVGQGALVRPDGEAVLSLSAKVAAMGARDEGWNALAVLHNAAARVGGLDVGFVPGDGGFGTGRIIQAAGTGEIDVVFLLGADEFDMAALGKAFVVYIGTHGDNAAHRADVVLPGAAYTEKSGTYVNTEGRVQQSKRAAFPPGDARDDWAILRALSDPLGHKLPFDSMAQLRTQLYAAHPHLARLDTIARGDLASLAGVAQLGGVTGSEPFRNPIADFYLTNPIARASAIMAQCSALAANAYRDAAE